MFAKGCHLFAQVVKLTVIASEPFVLPIIPVSSGRGGGGGSRTHCGAQDPN